MVTHPVVVRCRGVLIAGNYLGGHPIRGANKRVSLPDGTVQLRRDPEINWKRDSNFPNTETSSLSWKTPRDSIFFTEFNVSVVSYQNVLPFDVPVDYSVLVEMTQPLQGHRLIVLATSFVSSPTPPSLPPSIPLPPSLLFSWCTSTARFDFPLHTLHGIFSCLFKNIFGPHN